MGSIRRQRGTFGSNKKPFAGGNEIDVGPADSGSQGLPSFGSRTQSMWDNNTFRTPSPLRSPFFNRRTPSPSSLEDFYREMESSTQSKLDTMRRTMEAAATRLLELEGITGPDSDHPARAGVGRMHEGRRERAKRDPKVSLPVKPGRDHPLRVDRRLSMNHFNSTAPRNSILSAGASQV